MISEALGERILASRERAELFAEAVEAHAIRCLDDMEDPLLSELLLEMGFPGALPLARILKRLRKSLDADALEWFEAAMDKLDAAAEEDMRGGW